MASTKGPDPSRAASVLPSRAARPEYRCTQCGWTTRKWVGRCGGCQEWNTVEETAPAGGGLGGLGRRSPAARPMAQLPSSPAMPVAQVPLDSTRARATGVGELDRVLGGGLVPGAVVLVAGEPGVGKSTLLLEATAQVARGGSRVLYVSGEESVGQVRLRAERLGALSDDLFLAAEQELPMVLGHVDAVDPALLVVDSVQTMVDPQVDGAAGGTSQVRAVTGALIGAAKERGLPVLLVGHVTKDGTIAGPRALEHLVDVVLQIEGDRHSPLRLVRSVKNRYGATDEVGCFELVEDGIRELPDPSGLFLSGRHSAVPGTCVTVSLEGRRPMPVEIQALVAPCSGGQPRRTTTGIDGARLSMTMAVLHAHAGVALLPFDVYASTVGGARASEPAIDLPVALALATAASNAPLNPTAMAVGEVGLSGELRGVSGLRRRLTEARRLGFTDAIVPTHGLGDVAPDSIPGLTVHPVDDLASACRVARLRLRAPAPPDPEPPVALRPYLV